MSAPITYDEAEANRRLRAAEAVIAAARALLYDGYHITVRMPTPGDSVPYPGPLRTLKASLAAYDAATSDEDTAQTA